MDKTYIKVKGQWKYLYRAVDTAGQTIDFLLTAKRDVAAALRFFLPVFFHVPFNNHYQHHPSLNKSPKLRERK